MRALGEHMDLAAAAVPDFVTRPGPASRAPERDGRAFADLLGGLDEPEPVETSDRAADAAEESDTPETEPAQADRPPDSDAPDAAAAVAEQPQAQVMVQLLSEAPPSPAPVLVTPTPVASLEQQPLLEAEGAPAPSATQERAAPAETQQAPAGQPSVTPQPPPQALAVAPPPAPAAGVAASEVAAAANPGVTAVAAATVPVQQNAQGLRPARAEPIAPRQSNGKSVDTDKSDTVQREKRQEATSPQTPKFASHNAPKPESGVAAPANAGEAPPAAVSAASLAQHAASASSTTAVSEQPAARAAPAATQIAHEVVRRFNGESTRFELRLDPPELGRVEIRLDVSRDHRVTAIVSADSPQTLAELTRNARALEQNLQSAGLELSDQGLSFDLRQNRDGAENSGGDMRGRSGARTEPSVDAAPIPRPVELERWQGVRVDMMV